MTRFTNNCRCPRSVIIVTAVSNAWQQCGFPGTCWVTSLNDSVHMKGSKHYNDDAADFRTRTLTKPDIEKWADVCRDRLGKGYQVIVESDHLHVEFDPS
jgi:hypothetical protein